MARTCESLELDEIVEINRQVLEAFGGLPFAGSNNLRDEGILSVTLDSIYEELFGVELYPTIEEKAACLGWRIMSGHVFHDGNKRTGILSCATFLNINNLDLQVSLNEPDAEVLDLCVGAADNKVSLEEFTAWLKSRVIPYNPSNYE